jgi:peroxiredoxin
MRLLKLILLVLFYSSVLAQNKKPEYQIIIDGEIATQADVEFYAKQGRIQSMNKGVTDAQYQELVKRHGAEIGDQMFIMLITLHPEESYLEPRKSQLVDTSAKSQTENFNYKNGDKANNFKVELTDGSHLTLNALKGKVVLINFWATWCAPCIMEFYEMPKLIWQPYKNADFVFLPISIGEPRERVLKGMQKLKADGLDFTSGLDPDKTIFKQFAHGSIPKSIVIDRDGIVQLMTEGNPPGNMEKISNKIKELLDHQ